MFTRIAIVSAVVFLVSPLSAHAQLLRNRKQKDSQPTVIHMHTTTVQPIVSPIVTPIYTPVVAPVAVEHVVAHSPIISTYQPVVTSYRPPVSYVSEAPVVTASAVAIETTPVNRLPMRTPAFVPVRHVTGDVRLTNPRETEGTLYFSINNTSYALNPGEARTVVLDRELVIKFDNGNSKQMVYRLSEGAYEFTVNDSAGWDLIKRSNDAQSPQAKPETLAAPANSIPVRSTASTM